MPLAAPWCDILYAADRNWWRHYRDELPDTMHVSGETVEEKKLGNMVIPPVETIALKMLEPKSAMPHEPGSVVSGGHSGFQALGLALSLGGSKFVLLGYDCGGRQRNCHKNRPEKFNIDNNPHHWIQYYSRVKTEFPDIEVVNCSPESRIECFAKRSIEDAL